MAKSKAIVPRGMTANEQHFNMLRDKLRSSKKGSKAWRKVRVSYNEMADDMGAKKIRGTYGDTFKSGYKHAAKAMKGEANPSHRSLNNQIKAYHTLHQVAAYGGWGGIAVGSILQGQGLKQQGANPHKRTPSKSMKELKKRQRQVKVGGTLANASAGALLGHYAAAISKPSSTSATLTRDLVIHSAIIGGSTVGFGALGYSRGKKDAAKLHKDYITYKKKNGKTVRRKNPKRG